MKKYPFVHQSDYKDCGVSCLLMIIKYFGGNSSKEYLRMITNTDKDGTSFYDLVEAAREFRIESYGIEGNIIHLNKENLPLIAHTIIENKFEHFVVIYDIDFENNILIIGDPSKDRIEKMQMNEFEKISTNRFLTFESAGDVLNLKFDNNVFKITSKIIFSKSITLISLIFISFVFIFLSVGCTLLFSYFSSNSNLGQMFSITLFILIFANVLKNLIYFIRNNLLIKLMRYYNYSFFTNFYNHFLSLSNFYYRTRNVGEILTKFNDVEEFMNILSEFLLSFSIDIILIVAIVCIIGVISFELLILFFIFFLLYLTLLIFFSKNVSGYITRLKNSIRNKNNYLVDSISNISSVISSNGKKYLRNNFDSCLSKNLNDNCVYQKFTYKINFFSNLIIDIYKCVFVLLTFYLIKDKVIDEHYLVSLIFLNDLLISSISNFIYYYVTFKEIRQIIVRINEIYNISELKMINDDNISTISLKNITFKFRSNGLLLENLNLEIYSCDHILLYGNSGSGKSTLINIINGNYRNYSGTYLLNNINVKDFDVSNKVVCMTQHDNLLSATIRDNILLGKNIDNEKLNRVISILRLEQVIKNCPLAYDTVVEKDGGNLSSGDKQRILLARILLLDADVYIFDESLCNLDIQLERKILNDILDYLKEKIVIVISHRFYNNDLFNRLIRLEKGGIIYEKN